MAYENFNLLNLRETVVAYDESAQAYEDGGFDSASQYVARFAETLHPGARVLEVGCGLGTDAAELARANFIVTATDISTGMVEQAKRRYSDLGIDFRGGVSMTDLSEFPDVSFEAVIANFSLIHVPQKDTPLCLTEFARVLQPGGKLFLGLQEGESQEGLFPAPFDKGKTVFLHIFSPDEVNSALSSAWFEVTDRQVYAPRPGQHQFNKGITFARKIDG